jgi:glycerol-3-phosphate dehydrogenase
MVFTAESHGAVLLNYSEVTGTLADSDGFVNGVSFHDVETGEVFEARSRIVINATGPFADTLRLQAEPNAPPIIAPSQGIHLVFDSSFLPGDSAIMVPHTSDKRILFAIPWHGHTVVGTTDTPISEATDEPVATEREIEFILSTAALYLAKKPTRSDVLSVFAGIRPLVRAGDAGNTAALSRDHTIRIENSGMITICGGKWTTYRRMAEDCVNQAATLARLPERPCVTETLRIHASEPLPDSERLHPALPYTEAHVIRAVREEMARTVEDVLARRTRALFLNTRAAQEMAPKVAALIEQSGGPDPRLEEFSSLARNYLVAEFGKDPSQTIR